MLKLGIRKDKVKEDFYVIYLIV